MDTLCRTVFTPLVASLLLAVCAPVQTDSIAVYDVVFDATWSATTHPALAIRFE